MLYRLDRHEPLAGEPWSETAARRAIGVLVAAACDAFDPQTLWPLHPRDADDADASLPNPMLYNGAAGVIWALLHLQRLGLADVPIDFGATIDTLPAHGRRCPATLETDRRSYLFGDSGIALLQWKQRHDPAVADALYQVVEANLENPTLEALWGSSGTLIAALHMLDDEHAADQHPRWRALLHRGVQTLYAQMHSARHSAQPEREVWLWTQDMYGNQCDYLGAGHGFAGNVYPVLRGVRWLDDDLVQRFEARTEQTLAVSARHDAGLVNWEPWFDPVGRGRPHRPLVQDCHGAPGIICRLAATRSAVLRDLLLRGGELTWAAGPLNKAPGLCHGTDGNAYAFLKLHAMTGETRWLDRARAFAMHAIAQSEAEAAKHGMRRYSLWSGDLGLAACLASCITADPAFPTLDVF
jgi:hypothetical protein